MITFLNQKLNDGGKSMMRSAYTTTPTATSTSFANKYGSFAPQSNTNMNMNMNMDDHSSNMHAPGIKYSQYSVNYENKYLKNPNIMTTNSDNSQFTSTTGAPLTLSKTLNGGFSNQINDKSPINSNIY